MNLTTPLLVIGAALPRSGTASIKAALEMIGYRVFHALEWNADYASIWDSYVDADVSDDAAGRVEHMDAFVRKLSDDGFNATLDQPSCFVYRELAEKYYPDAKVLLTQREASSWARSMLDMSYSIDIVISHPPFNWDPDAIKGPWGNWSKAQLGIRREEVHPNGIAGSDNVLERKSSVSLAVTERAYREYQESVLKDVPEERLVQVSVKQGWEPLCRHFLPTGRTCPGDDGEPFPRTNTAETSFLLDIRRKASIRTALYRVHPWLSGKRIGGWLYALRFGRGWMSKLSRTVVVAALVKAILAVIPGLS
ncbi:hypothetical protein ACHAWF_006214 [Thalassiosira exigua]